MASTAIVPISPTGQELYRSSTDAAGLCKEIVVSTAINIQGRKYVRVEGWQAIAIAHGCIASSGEVERVSDPDCPGYRAVGKIVRVDTGAVIATAEGFVGDDEKTWSGRAVYARRAMAQTRAISRACRSAFAHVVVMMNAGLETTPAEEVPVEGFSDRAGSAYVASLPKPPVAEAAEEPSELAVTLQKSIDQTGQWKGGSVAVTTTVDLDRVYMPGKKGMPDTGKPLSDPSISLKGLKYWEERLRNPETPKDRAIHAGLVEAIRRRGG